MADTTTLADTAGTVVSVPEIFNDWLHAGRIDLRFLAAARLDSSGAVRPGARKAAMDR